ncbi:MAG: dimethylarginine dimethylaminohydrolase family protein [Alphaproteobacteria bacterium]
MTRAQAPRARILMSRPDFFEVSYVINPWMHPEDWAADADTLTETAREEWEQLYKTFRKLDIELELAPPVDGLPDMVFTANAGIVLDRKALVARFKCPERQGEEPVFERFFEELKDRGLIDEVRMMPEGVFQEGAGDCIWDRKRKFFWAGYGQRSVREAADEIARYFGKEVVPLELATPEFYHMDVCMCPLSGGDIIYYPGAFTEESLAILRERVDDPGMLIEAPGEDAEQLAVNAVNVGRNIVMAACGPELRAKLEARGYRVFVVPLTAFRRSGGAAFCLTLRLDLDSQAEAEQPVPAAAAR